MNKKKKLSMEAWENIFINTQESGEDIEVVYLDNVGEDSEWCLCCGEELFEDGYKTEDEAQKRLEYLESIFLGDVENISAIQSQLAKDYSDHIRRTAPWILSKD
jgi:hypothetical protein